MVSEESTPQPRTSLQLDATSGIRTHNFSHPSSSRGKRSKRSKVDERGSLLPNLPDDFTISLILPRLPWRVLPMLTQLNRAWRATLRSPEVYDARARATTLQTIVTIHATLDECVISLHDTATETWHLLHVPRFGFGYMSCANGCGCVTMHGKLYILGGQGSGPRNNVYVFDFAGQGCWKECASMKICRSDFACAVHGRKIYVFGGDGAGTASEVYDPKQDLWCDIAPMLTPHRRSHKVVTVGNVFCIHMGLSSNDALEWDYGHCAEIYDPRRDRWTVVSNFKICSPLELWTPEPRAKVVEATVVIDEKLHGILDDCLYVYEEPSNVGTDSKALKWDGTGSWKAIQSISWGAFEAASHVNPFARDALTIASGGELVALVFGPIGSGKRHRRWTLLESQGLGCVDRKLSWKRVGCSSDPRFPEWMSRKGKREKYLSQQRWKARHEGSYLKFVPCLASIAGPW